uniref:Uncharacterized protein n=1 Tax=Panagrolaimus davidi TaxID=227884 RepID=A0A914PS68_9BILA
MGERKTFHFDFNKNYSVEVNFSESESLIKAFRSAEISRNPSLTLHNVGNIEGLDLNANFDRYITDITDITSAGASYSFGKNCGFTISGECSDKSITTTLMVTEKRTGIGFGIEYKLTGDVKTLTVQKHEFSFVIKASIGGEEITLKFVFLKVPGADAVAGGNNSDKAQKPNKDGDPENDGNGSSDSDKSGAAKAECDSILIDVDFVNGKICQKVVTYIFEKAVQDQTLLLAENVGTPELVQEIPVVDNSLNMVPTEVRREENNTAQDVGVQELVQEIPY